jgi:hypothetical protein
MLGAEASPTPDMCAFIATFDVICGCPQRPDDTKETCSICPNDEGLKNPYVFFFFFVYEN